jgi:hypothetical protein
MVMRSFRRFLSSMCNAVTFFGFVLAFASAPAVAFAPGAFVVVFASALVHAVVAFADADAATSSSSRAVPSHAAVARRRVVVVIVIVVDDDDDDDVGIVRLPPENNAVVAGHATRR